MYGIECFKYNKARPRMATPKAYNITLPIYNYMRQPCNIGIFDSGRIVICFEIYCLSKIKFTDLIIVMSIIIIIIFLMAFRFSTLYTISARL